MPTDLPTPARSSGDGPVSAPTRRPRLVRWGVLLVLVGLLLALRATVATPVRVTSASMEPTFDAGDVVLVSRRAPTLEDLDHGDLVTFVSPEDGRRTIKRVI